MDLLTIPEEETKKIFPKGVFTKELPAGKKYLRYTPYTSLWGVGAGAACLISTVSQRMPAANHVSYSNSVKTSCWDQSQQMAAKKWLRS